MRDMLNKAIEWNREHYFLHYSESNLFQRREQKRQLTRPVPDPPVTPTSPPTFVVPASLVLSPKPVRPSAGAPAPPMDSKDSAWKKRTVG
jgi:hypothetical protein